MHQGSFSGSSPRYKNSSYTNCPIYIEMTLGQKADPKRKKNGNT